MFCFDIVESMPTNLDNGQTIVSVNLVAFQSGDLNPLAPTQQARAPNFSLSPARTVPVSRLQMAMFAWNYSFVIEIENRWNYF